MKTILMTQDQQNINTLLPIAVKGVESLGIEIIGESEIVDIFNVYAIIYFESQTEGIDQRAVAIGLGLNDADLLLYPELTGDKIVVKVNERDDKDYEAIAVALAIAVAIRAHLGGDVYTLIGENLTRN